MELNELRSRWQRAAAEAPVTADVAALTQLVAHGTRNSVAKLLRNARLEVGFTGLALLLSAGALLYVENLQHRVTLVWLIILCLVSIVSYHRQLLRGIQGLEAADAPVREQLAQQLNALRKVMRRSYQSALWTLPVTFGIGFFFSLSRTIAQYSGLRLLTQLGFLVVGTGVAGAIAYFIISRVGHRYLQDLYGKHLDQLERSLAELTEPDADASR